MGGMKLAGNNIKTVFCIDRQPRGIERVACSVAEDIRYITGQKRPDKTRLAGTSDPYTGASANADVVVIAGIAGQGSWIDTAAGLGLIDYSGIVGKRECYRMTTARLDDGRKAILIAGSDLLGAEYGLYKLSGLCGVSPWHYWADVTPKKRDVIEIDEKELDITSSEPAVKLRGFFMNDEWPSLGGWATEKFGGFNELFYQHVFDLLLRLRGNYLWPAMWTGVFSEDGLAYPTASAELANDYGIIMGTSHHEPLFRAGEEFSYCMTGDNSKGYGADWNYNINQRGIYSFWEDSVKRNKDFKNLITIGMRGERDSKLLGENATLSDNIDMIKKTIIDQKKILAENGLADAPKMLALYKEVEDYFYGDENTEGLKDWHELDDVMFLLSDDNYGNTRTLPTPENRDRPAGWGLYYHFDYHGAPISHEWVNSTPIEKAWEQLTTAYTFGIRELWVANVGDLRPDELPLSYFMDLAFDYDKHSKKRETELWLKSWTLQQFDDHVSNYTANGIAAILHRYTHMNGDRRPEAVHPDTFSFTEQNEAERELERARELAGLAEEYKKKIPPERSDAYYGLVEFPARASANLREMMIYTGMQRLYADIGSAYANELADKVNRCVELDKELCAYYNEKMADGKWRHMMSSKHVDFQNWNDEGSVYPDPKKIELEKNGELLVCLPGCRVVRESAALPVFTSTENKSHRFILTSTSERMPEYSVTLSDEWIELEYDSLSSDANNTGEYTVSIDWKALGADWEQKDGAIKITSGEKTVELTLSLINTPAYKVAKNHFVESDCTVSMNSYHYYSEHNIPEASWYWVPMSRGDLFWQMKVLPADTFCPDPGKAPYLEYSFTINHPGEYTVTCVLGPTNNPVKFKGQRFGLQLDGGEIMVIDSLPEGFAAGDPADADWCRYVLDNCRRRDTKMTLAQGEHVLKFIHIDAGIVLQKIEIALEPSKAFYGLRETYRSRM